jgi:hypothetical protein
LLYPQRLIHGAAAQILKVHGEPGLRALTIVNYFPRWRIFAVWYVPDHDSSLKIKEK